MGNFDFQQTGPVLQEIINSVGGKAEQTEVNQLRALYEALTQSDIVPVASADWPVSDPQQNVIYRVAGDESYTDYMWNGTQFVPMATYNITPTGIPVVGSTDVITAGGVANHGSAFDISEYNKSGSTLATYADLDTALAAVPSSVQKGGMSVKFVSSVDNKYVQKRYMGTSIANADFTNVANWQGVGEDTSIMNFVGILQNGNTFDDVHQNSTVNFKVEAGHEYLIVSSAGANFSSNNGSENIETFGMTVANVPKIINPTLDADYIRVGQTVGEVNINFTITEISLKHRIDEIDVIEIPQLKEKDSSIEDNINTKLLSYKTFDVSSATSVVYNFKAGNTYIITNLGSGTNFTTRNSSSGDTVEDIGWITGSGGSKEFICTVDAKYLRIAAATSGNVFDKAAHDYRIKELESDVHNLEQSSEQTAQEIFNLERKVDGNKDFTLTGAGSVEYLFKAGKKYLITNSGTGRNFTTRNTTTGETVEDIAFIAGGTTYEFNCTVDAKYLRVAGATNGRIIPKDSHELRITNIENELNDSIKPQLAHVTDKVSFNKSSAGTVAYPFKAGGTYIIYNSSDHGVNLSTRATSSGETVETLPRIEANGAYVVFNCTIDANYLRHNPGITGYIIDAATVEGQAIYNKINNANTDKELAKAESAIITPLMVRFDVKHELPNIHAEYEQFDWAWAKDSAAVATPFVTQVYNAFDGLVSNYPNQVSKIDLAVEYDMTYPRYANGIGAGDAEYLETPAYKIYMYKILSSTNANTNLNPKKKVLIIACCQGYEFSMAFDTYVFANYICKLYDANFFKFQAACDFYIVPVMDPYGVYHKRRCNANGVNLNRNFDVPGGTFVVSGEPGGWTNYTGPYAYSEFESQLIKAVVDDIHPDMVIDHHEFFNVRHSIIFSTSNNKAIVKSGYEALADMAYTFIKEKSEWFGTKWDMFLNYNYSLPATVTNDIGYTIEDWVSYYQEGCLGILIEGFSKISMLNGETDSETGDANNYTEGVMACAAYSFQTQMMYFVETMCKIKLL